MIKHLDMHCDMISKCLSVLIKCFIKSLHIAKFHWWLFKSIKCWWNHTHDLLIFIDLFSPHWNLDVLISDALCINLSRRDPWVYHHWPHFVVLWHNLRIYPVSNQSCQCCISMQFVVNKLFYIDHTLHYYEIKFIFNVFINLRLD